LPGVHNVKADHKTQRVRLALEKERTSVGQVIDKLEFLGYRVVQGG
jgi:copper chaperone CopZ